MSGFLSLFFGSNKSEKDIKRIQPLVVEMNQAFSALQSLTNDELRAKTVEFKGRIKDHLNQIDTQIAELDARAESLPFNDISG